ncbi:hypothetical protein CH373_16665 [Leptospira perolatii]|uniref:Uncharacterized protein n=1 Tax=Leptospira perolatii TaxID=2023191 RepID=A0A2M9ZIT5_9LEPT|nr:hypothetical protein [Leptospira perolatii]PJZ68628.1 hypothetical protein CH360_15210 [Leptospira perolatii]PJZ71975.1 hypothetical protein CH373_16665 [Leptospira perolatii]
MERVKDSRFLFDLKRKFRYILEEVEKATFDQTSEVRELESLWEEMFEIASKNDTPYFRARLTNLKRQLDGFVRSKAYEKGEFDRIYRQLEKIRRDDTVEFLDESMRGNLERVSKQSGYIPDLRAAQKQLREPSGLSAIPLFLTFRCGTIHFIVKSGPKKIFKNIHRTKDKVLYEGKKYPIFPSRSVYFSWEPDRNWEMEPGNLLMIRNVTKVRFFRYDSLGDTFRIPEETFQRRLQPAESGWTKSYKYFRKAGIRYYYIPDSEDGALGT